MFGDEDMFVVEEGNTGALAPLLTSPDTNSNGASDPPGVNASHLARMDPL